MPTTSSSGKAARTVLDTEMGDSCSMELEVRSNAYIERSVAGIVQGTMDQLKVIVVTLFPAFCLVTSPGALAGQGSEGPLIRCFVSVSAREGGTPAPLKVVNSFERASRAQIRRLDAGTGLEGPSGIGAVCAGRTATIFPVGFLLALTEPSDGLARNWQFSLRAALEPRAPSSST